MKKLITILLSLCLCGCATITTKVDEFKLKKLGYSEEDISTIFTLNETNQELFLNEYNYKLLTIVNTNGFIEDNIHKYLEFYNVFEDEKMIELVNNNILTTSSMNKLVEMYNSEFYVDELEDLYLQYFDKYADARDLLEIVNTKRYEKLYSDISQTDTSKDYLMLINKYYSLPSTYEPTDLVQIDSYYGVGQTRKEVYEQYKKLQDEANELGYVFTICSAYRSYDTQDILYNRYLASEGGNVEATDMYSARPGHSEHQSGLCLDLTTPVYGMDNFGESDASKWVDENCYKYGFIIRYTKNKEKITGYEAEPWQIRYVGDSETAKYIMDTGITFDEYYRCFVE